MAINNRDFYASHGISYDIEEMQIEYTKRVIKQAKIEVLTELQLDIQEVNTAPQFLTDDNVKDFRECVDTIIQQKINELKGK